MYLQASTIAAGLVAGLRRLKSKGSTRSSPTESTSALSASRLWARFQSSKRLFDEIATRIRARTASEGAGARLYRQISAAIQICNAACVFEAHSHPRWHRCPPRSLHWISLYFGYAFIIIFNDNAKKCIHVLYIYSYKCSCKCIV